MTDTQILTVVLATTPTFIVVLVGILLNNARIGDLRAEMRQALGDLRDVLRAEMAKNQSEMLAKFAELDVRLTRLEAKFSG